MKQLLLFFLLSIPAFAQKSFLVKDSSTNEPIAYTSIFTENGTFKVNAEPDGSFIIPNNFYTKCLFLMPLATNRNNNF
ncbi:peptidase associated/transthyretin-like domain-containing protein [Paenimyroides viscosum]|uniref:Uncharacterized protein n=1 Tax=Paenimyroides viscosum TaxID=2488729 RepID=A0A3P1ARZ2_9FLAO|nr:hypothetical protein [Paenimyroides viscosum]RRA91756.1 hypothetical protein EG242_12315 [Paenimyroides viscosum]